MPSPNPGSPEAVAQALRELDDYLHMVGGCTDGYCIVVKPQGMHTNGGCTCYRDFMKMQRFAFAHNRFRDAVAAIISTPVQQETGDG
jgi:hypothetical protein